MWDGQWAHPARDWEGGRVVAPHTDPAGQIINLYGRAVGSDEQVPKAQRHDHLPGDKALFNAPALLTGDGPLFINTGKAMRNDQALQLAQVLATRRSLSLTSTKRECFNRRHRPERINL